MIVELCGVPGGGKSTLARAYVTRPGSGRLLELSMHRRLPEAAYALLFALFHPYAFIMLCSFVGRHHAPGLFRYSLHLMLRAMAKYQKGSLIRGTVLIDEGLLHTLMTLPGTSLPKEELRRWYDRVPKPARVAIALSGDFHRFHRGDTVIHPRLKQGSEELAAWEQAVRENARTLRSLLVESGLPAFLIPERGAGTPEKNAQALATFLDHD